MSRTIIQSVLHAHLVELKNCHALQLIEKLPKRPNSLELCRWSMPFHTNQQIIRGSFQLSSQTDRNQTKWLKFLIDAATGIKASGVGTKRLCGNISPATDRMPTAAQVPNRNGSPSVVSIRRRPRDASNGKTFKTDGPDGPGGDGGRKDLDYFLYSPPSLPGSGRSFFCENHANALFPR